MGSLNIDIDVSAVMAKYGAVRIRQVTTSSLESTMEFAVGRVRERMESHVKTGHMRNAVGAKLTTPKEGLVAVFGGVFYTPFVERGTGIYGPNKRPIVPKVAKALAWHGTTATGKPTGQRIVRRSVRGQPAVHMFHATATEDRERMAQHFETTFKRQLGI